jgi:hypothetical protein
MQTGLTTFARALNGRYWVVRQNERDVVAMRASTPPTKAIALLTHLSEENPLTEGLPEERR